MQKLNILGIAKTAGKLLFDVEPEITEVMAMQLFTQTSLAAAEVVPVIVEAIRCQKTRIASYFQPRTLQSTYKMAA